MAPKCLSGFYIITPLGYFPDIFNQSYSPPKLTRDINLLCVAYLPNILFYIGYP